MEGLLSKYTPRLRCQVERKVTGHHVLDIPGCPWFSFCTSCGNAYASDGVPLTKDFYNYTDQVKRSPGIIDWYRQWSERYAK